MAIRYWGVPLSEDECQLLLSELSVPAFQGADAAQILKVVEKVVGVTTEPDLDSLETKLDDFITLGAVTTAPSPRTAVSFKQEFFHARGLGSLKSAFGPPRPIPQIVLYDDLMAAYNDESPGGHASLVKEVDFDTQFIYLIDPNAQKRRSPTYYTFEDFERGWKCYEQATIILYPASSYLTARSVTTTLSLGDRIE